MNRAATRGVLATGTLWKTSIKSMHAIGYPNGLVIISRYCALLVLPGSALCNWPVPKGKFTLGLDVW
jgi:hypothetical protein